MMRRLPIHQIDCWYLPVRELPPETYQALLSGLSPEEQAQHDAFHFQRDQLRYLLTRTMVRRLLAGYLSVAASDLVFETNEYGRPRLVGDQNHLALDFNLSHTSDYIVCALMREGKVGVDIESYWRKRDLNVAADFFAPTEVKQLMELNESDRNKRFVEFWSLKEAFIKGAGKGMAIPLHAFYYRLQPGQISFADPEGWGGRQLWHFRMLEAPESHILALAAAPDQEASSELQWKIRAFELVEIQQEVIGAWKFYRTSSS
jgi:4'-phosphopantetheinyl transferase